jgi:hypothetical protein
MSTSLFDAFLMISGWVREENIEVLNVAGSRASKDPEIYQKTRDIIESVCYFTAEDEYDSEEDTTLPESVDEAVDRLIPKMEIKQKVALANMNEEDLELLHTTSGRYFEAVFRLWTENEALMESCRERSGIKDLHPDSAFQIIIEALWERLRDTHKLRVVK